MKLFVTFFLKPLCSLFLNHKLSLNSQRGIAPLIVVVVIALIAAAVPTTVILIQQDQDTRQEAQVVAQNTNCSQYNDRFTQCVEAKCAWKSDPAARNTKGTCSDPAPTPTDSPQSICRGLPYLTCVQVGCQWGKLSQIEVGCKGNVFPTNTPTPRGTSTGPTAIPAPKTCPVDSKDYIEAPNCGQLGFDNSKFYTGSSGGNRCCWVGFSSSIEIRPSTPTNAPTPTPIGTGGGGVQPTPTPIPPPPTTKGFCADGNRQYDKPVNTPSCVINSTVYRQQFDSYCHNTYGSPSDFFYECLAANAPATASGYCANATATSNPISINNPTCGLANASYDSNYDKYCVENYGNKDSQSKYFYKCPAPTSTPPPTTITPQPGTGGSGGTCQPGSPVETCSCPGTGNCSASTGGPAYTNWGCFTTSFDSQARCCPNDRRYACADGTCKANFSACATSAPTGCAAPNPSAQKTGYECESTTWAGCGGGLTCQPATNSQTGCLCKGTGSSSPTATPTPKSVVVTATPAFTYTPPANCVNNPAYTKCGTAADAGKSCNYPGGVGYWGWKGEGQGCNLGSGTQIHCYVCSYQ